MGEVSHKLVTAQYERQQFSRIDAMYSAIRKWRAELIAAMAARIAEIGDAPDDAVLGPLLSEMRQLEFVTRAMNADPFLLHVVDTEKPK